ncbi:hypothetical protein [Kitasatospora sp. NPDC088548]|uniref:hypothetical protein n=1 Tax=Kitasatospora sp. NPDC088548 TaxID=3364075 RepID=UPI0038277083
MGEELGAVAVTAGVNAIAALMARLDWGQLVGRAREILVRHRGGAPSPQEPEAGLPNWQDLLTGAEGEDESDRARRLQAIRAALAQMRTADLNALVGELTALGREPARHETSVTVNGGKAAVNSGSGDQNVTFN